MYSLNELRAKVDEIDKIIIKSFIERLKVVKEINTFKLKNNLPIFDSETENEFLLNRKQMVNDISLNNYIENLFKLILDISKDYQNKEQQNSYSNLAQDFKQNKFQEKNIFENKIYNINKLNLNNITNKNNDLIPSGNNLDWENLENSKRNDGCRRSSLLERKEKRYKTLEEKFKIKENKKRGRNKNLIKSVYSLNIPSDNPKNINLIEKFNKIVDKLNDQKIKSFHERKEKESEEKDSINKKHYKIYKFLKDDKNAYPVEVKNRNELRRNFFNICDNQNSKKFSSFNKDKKQNIIFNKTRIFDIRKNINESKIKIDLLKTSRTSDSSNRLAQYRNRSSIVLPSNSYYH